ncbi:hypothetical protein CSKR_106118, partial [Clonorchis sinensis]
SNSTQMMITLVGPHWETVKGWRSRTNVLVHVVVHVQMPGLKAADIRTRKHENIDIKNMTQLMVNGMQVQSPDE